MTLFFVKATKTELGTPHARPWFAAAPCCPQLLSLTRASTRTYVQARTRAQTHAHAPAMRSRELSECARKLSSENAVHTQIVRPQWKRRLWTRVGHTARRAWNLGIKVIPLAVFELQDALPFPLSPGRKLASVVGIVVWSTEALAEEAQDHVQFLYTCMRTCA